jgi:hypothetical protein
MSEQIQQNPRQLTNQCHFLICPECVWVASTFREDHSLTCPQCSHAVNKLSVSLDEVKKAIADDALIRKA